MNELARARTEAGLTQREMAARLGVDQSVISAYETGRRTPTIDTLRRFAGALGAVAVVDIVPRPAEAGWCPATLAETAAHVADAIDNPPLADRYVHEFLRGHQEADLPRRHSLVIEEPPGTGHRGYDALLAGFAEHLSFLDCRSVPGWTGDPSRFLDQAWYWTDIPSLHERFHATSPAAFSRRLVFLDPVDLVSV